MCSGVEWCADGERSFVAGTAMARRHTRAARLLLQL